jgi:hypothetical protein
VIKPESSGTLTTSLVISLHDLQTEAQATTSLLPGHKLCSDSILWIISRSNSGGKSTQILWFKPSLVDKEEDTDDPSGAMCDLPLLPIALYLFFTMFFNDIATLILSAPPEISQLRFGNKSDKSMGKHNYISADEISFWILLLPMKTKKKKKNSARNLKLKAFSSRKC